MQNNLVKLSKRSLMKILTMDFRGIMSNKHLLTGHGIHEGLDQAGCGKIENESERDADRQSGQGFAENGEQQQGEAEADQNGNETRQRSIPIAYRKKKSK